MSKLEYDPLLNQLALWYTSREMLGRFHNNCDCDIHGDKLHFTDKSGADWCTECIKEQLAPNQPTKAN